jgi:hypothetical protein
VEAMLRDPSTPNDLKLQGFATVLVNEWLLANPDVKVEPTIFFSRSLNCVYSKVVRVISSFDFLKPLYVFIAAFLTYIPLYFSTELKTR